MIIISIRSSSSTIYSKWTGRFKLGFLVFQAEFLPEQQIPSKKITLQFQLSNVSPTNSSHYLVIDFILWVIGYRWPHIISKIKGLSFWFWRETRFSDSWQIIFTGLQWRKQMATGSCWHPWLDSPAWVRVLCTTIWSWPRTQAHRIHNLCITPLLKSLKKIPRIPSSWKPEFGNNKRSQWGARSLTGTVGQASSYLFLRMKLLLENLKLCCGTHDMLVPILLGSGRGFAPPWKSWNTVSVMNGNNPKSAVCSLSRSDLNWGRGGQGERLILRLVEGAFA